MSEEIEHIAKHAPIGATHWGREPSGKLFYALEFKIESECKTKYLYWMEHTAKWYLTHIKINYSELTSLK